MASKRIFLSSSDFRLYIYLMNYESPLNLVLYYMYTIAHDAEEHHRCFLADCCVE